MFKINNVKYCFKNRSDSVCSEGLISPVIKENANLRDFALRFLELRQRQANNLFHIDGWWLLHGCGGQNLGGGRSSPGRGRWLGSGSCVAQRSKKVATRSSRWCIGILSARGGHIGIHFSLAKKHPHGVEVGERLHNVSQG